MVKLWIFFGIKRAFTLVEVLVAFVISSAIILGLGMLYHTTLKTQETFNRYKTNESKTELLILLQRQSYALRDLKIKQGFNSLELSYLTNYGQVKPFVRVEILFGNKGITYRELNPYSGKEIARFYIPWKCKAILGKKDVLELTCGENKYSFILNRLK